jgi:hypothetical protein
MNNLKSYLLATIGIVGLVASLTVNIARADNTETAVTISTAHFASGRTYLLSPANGSGTITCKVTSVDGAWLYCDGRNEWVNTNAMMFAADSAR